MADDNQPMSQRGALGEAAATSLRGYTELFRSHIKQILSLDHKSPIHAVPLLVTIACETLGRLMGCGDGSGAEVFAKELRWPADVTETMARKIYDVLRNGLAHVYGPYPFILDEQQVRLIMTWKDGPHLRPVGVRLEGIHARLVPVGQGDLSGSWFCVDARSLWHMLDQAFRSVEERLATDTDLARKISENSGQIRAAKPHGPQGPAAAEWRAFLSPATVGGQK